MMVEMSQLSGASMTHCGWVRRVVGGEDLNGISQHTSAVDLAKTNCSNVKNNKKSKFFSGEMLSIGICCVVIASICSEKTCKKKSCVPTLYRECYHTL